VRPFVKFVEDLTNWYIRRSRRRFWKSQNDGDKICAYRTLRYVLVQLSKVAAPFTPFIAEQIYLNLKGNSDPESVHLCDFPTPNSAARQGTLEKSMDAVMTVVELARRLRADNDLKVRQPLASVMVAGASMKELEDIVLDELNIKKFVAVADERSLCDVSYKANFKTLGKKCGPKMKAVSAAIAALGELSFPLEIEGIAIAEDDILVTRAPKVGLAVASQGEIVVGIDTKLDETLVAEGNAREFVSHV
jgi:isoleucyl-tRNA synthetase